MYYFLITLLAFILFSCNYPDIDEIPKYANFEITYEDRKNIRIMVNEMDEIKILKKEKEMNMIILSYKQYGLSMIEANKINE